MAEPLVNEVVALARAETYHLMGEPEASVEAVLPLVAGSGLAEPMPSCRAPLWSERRAAHSMIRAPAPNSRPPPSA